MSTVLRPCLLQEVWNNVQQQGINNSNNALGDGTLLLRVIANSALRFPSKQAAHLAADLFKVSSTRLNCLFQDIH